MSIISLQSNEKTFTIRYNAEITNLKHNYADSVQTTLGSPYPFIRRNGEQKYRTFTITGLISALIVGDTEITYDTAFGVFAKDLTIDEIEKQYRDRVIAFLCDGCTKTLQSEHLGEIKVRLTNINFTPKKELDGMIYSFTAQATEVRA